MTLPLTANTLVKFTAYGRMPAQGGKGRWPIPGQWQQVRGQLIPCRNGLHVTTIQQSPAWIAEELWTVEVRGERIDHRDGDKIIVQRARLVQRVKTWNPTTARLYACDVAERGISAFNAEGPQFDAAMAMLNDIRRATLRRHDASQVESELLCPAECRDIWAAWHDEHVVMTTPSIVTILRQVQYGNAFSAAESISWTVANAVGLLADRGAGWSSPSYHRLCAFERAWQGDRLLAYLTEQVDLDALCNPQHHWKEAPCL